MVITVMYSMKLLITFQFILHPVAQLKKKKNKKKLLKYL